MEEIRILGAGPAGLTAAICLARKGARVRVIEHRRDCGLRFRGDLQGIENWSSDLDVLDEFKSMGIDATPLRPFTSITQTNGKKTTLLKLQKPAFYIVKRGSEPDSLDQFLKRQAIEAGVRIDFNTAMSGTEVDIVATGPVAGMIAAIAKGVTFSADLPDMAIGILNRKLASHAYGYVLIAGGRGCIATVLFADFHKSNIYLHRLLDFVHRQFGIAPKEVSPMGGVGHFAIRKRFTIGPTMFVGEAAGLQDLLWGFGIRTAMNSGCLAAQCILRDCDYAELASRHFGKQQSSTVVNRFLWEVLSAGRYHLLMALLHRYNLRLLRSFHSFNPLQQTLYPLALSWVRFRYPQIWREP